MWGKFTVAFLFHLGGLILLLLPNRLQGQVVTRLLGVPLRALDVTGIILIVVGSVFLNVYLLTSFRRQAEQIKQMPPKDEAGKTNGGVN